MNEKVHDYHDGNRQLQDRFDTRRLADHLTGRVTETIGESQKEFIEKADMFFLATCDHRGLPTCSYKGGDPGFVRVLDEKWLAFPNYDGNGKFQSMGNLLKNPNVGMLFVDFEGQQRLRLQGIAAILDDDELLSQYPEWKHQDCTDKFKRQIECKSYNPERKKYQPKDRQQHNHQYRDWPTHH